MASYAIHSDGVRTLARLLQTTAKIGDQVGLLFRPDSLTLRGLNAGRSAFVAFSLNASFFQTTACARTAHARLLVKVCPKRSGITRR